MASKKTIEAKFTRAGINPINTHLWDDMQSSLKLEIQAKIDLQFDESIIICFYQSTHYSILLTTHSIIILENNTITNLPYTSIGSLKLDTILSGEKSKVENDTINVFLKSGDMVNIKVEKGTWHILYSILKLLIL